ncbi:MAG: protein translocase subunit SecD [Rhodocyclaceae bacterium]|nr:protein translocase subunit SecD [Rhodocyclaceae bacterium]
MKAGDKHRIIVELPGIKDTAEAVASIGRTANLNFREELQLNIPNVGTETAGRIYFNPDSKLKGADIKKATVTFDQNTGKPQVALSFSDKGAKIFGELTTKNVGKQIGIFLDDQVLVAPVVQQPILDGNGVITTQYTLDQTRQLAMAINSGALPVPIKLIEQRTIGPSLGAEEIQKSVIAGGIGLTAVALFMVLNYGGLGFIACVGLIIYGLISFGLFRLFSVTLTLSGVAGFILSIGMAVDSNILIFERIKEEKRKGRSHLAAIQLGFGRAIDAIKDANTTTLLVAFILYNPLNWEFFPQLGLIKGFALTLAIGVVVSLFTGVVITKRLINIFYKAKAQ